MTQMTSSHNGVAQKPKEVSYVEDVLKVPDLWNAADQAAAEIGAILNRKSVQLSALADCDEKIRGHERELQLKLMAEESYEKLSVAAQERAVKAQMLADDTLQVMYSKRHQLKTELDQLDNDVAGINAQHRTHLTRLKAATGVMDFLTAARNARTAAETLLPY